MHTTCEKTKRGQEGNNNNMHSRVAASQIKQAKRRLENWTGEKVSQMWTENFKKSKMHNWADKKKKAGKKVQVVINSHYTTHSKSANTKQ